MEEFLDDYGLPNSVYPCTKYLTFGPWIYLVPQYKPESILMLGYAGGTTAGLIRLLYGDIPITAVDIIVPHRILYDNVTFIRADAKQYVKTCEKFDCVIVDLFPNDSMDICNFVKTKEFVSDLKRISRYIIINSIDDIGWQEYEIFQKIGENKPSNTKNLIKYYANGNIPEVRYR